MPGVKGVGLEPMMRRMYDLFRLRNQILNLRRECEVTMLREEKLIIISSFLEQVDLVLNKKFLFDPLAIREVEQVKR